MMLNGYCSAETEFDKIFQYIPQEAFIRINSFHNIEHRERWELPARQTDEYIMVYIRSGNGHYIIHDEHFDFKKNSILLIAPHTVFSARGDMETPSLYSVRFQLVQSTGEQVINIHDQPLYLHYNESNNYNELFEKLYTSYIVSTDMDLKKCLCNAVMSEILCHLWQDIHQSGQRFDMKINKAKVFIEKNPLRKHTISELAGIAGLSELYFSKKFRQHFAISPKSYIFDVKMKYAKNLLMEYCYTVKEVAYLLGYSDPYIFSNQFKKTFGISPSCISKVRK